MSCKIGYFNEPAENGGCRTCKNIELKLEMKKLKPRVIMNMGRSNNDIEMGNRLHNLVRNKLNIDIEYIGFIPYDERVPISVAKRTPISIYAPNSPYTSVLDSIARRIISTSNPDSIYLQDVTENLEDLVKDYYKNKTI